ncbi:MAG: thiE [Acidobacteria bacterium]|nr:thiE [Acidobacteriota bacterium]
MICLVTDRWRLVAAGAAPAAARACLIAQVQRAAGAGVDLVQVRERDLEAGALASLVTDLLAAAAGTPCRILVNDRLDVALACGAGGVHLRGDSIPIAAARRWAPPGFLVGRSVHGVADAIDAGGADYLIAGTVFATRSKPADAPLLGLEGLRSIVARAPAPVLAIGGVSVERLDDIAAAGAAGFAAIGLFMASHPGAEPSGCGVVELRQTVKAARARFDRLNTTP